MKIGARLVDAIKKDAENVLMKIHQTDFSGKMKKSFEPESGDPNGYMNELTTHVKYYHATILQNLSCGAEPKSW